MGFYSPDRSSKECDIYDTVGVKGLELELPENSPALMPKYRKAQEIYAEYERQMRERGEWFIERKKSQGKYDRGTETFPMVQGFKCILHTRLNLHD